VLVVRDGALDTNGYILAVADLSGAAVLVRFTPAGAVDTTFGSGGYVSLSTIKPFAMRLQADGRILIGGTRIVNKAVAGSVVRLNSDGTLDRTFGSNGQASIASVEYLYALALQSINSQQYVLAGGASSGKFALARLNPSGSIDASFGGSGIASTDFCGAGSTVFSVNVDPLGNILAGGTAAITSQGPPKFGIARFTQSGVLDTAFGDPSNVSLGRTGQTMLDFFGSENHLASLVPVFDANGNETYFIAAGYAYQSSGSSTFNKYLVATRYHFDGSLDTTFGSNGTGGAVVDFGNANTYLQIPATNSSLIQSDGKVILSGTAGFTSGVYSGYNFALARIWP